MNAKSITLQSEHARWALRAALSAASKDDVTPVLCAVHWVIAGGKVSIAGTDRYRVHEAVIDAPADAPEGEFIMGRDQAQWILANFHKPIRLYGDQLIRIEWVEPDTSLTMSKRSTPQERRAAAGTITVDILASDADAAPTFRFATEAVAGKFPPIRKLMPSATDAVERMGEVALSPNLLASLANLTRHRGEPLRFVMPKVTEGKYQPVLVQNAEGTARALVQPNMMLSAKEWTA
jgi:hypothetical protein